MIKACNDARGGGYKAAYGGGNSGNGNSVLVMVEHIYCGGQCNAGGGGGSLRCRLQVKMEELGITSITGTQC